MTLGELIGALKQADPNCMVKRGLQALHSYRGHYIDLAFELAGPMTVREILAVVEPCVGQTFQGYKGGDYKMHEYTDVWLANYSECGETIGPVLLSFLLNDVVAESPEPAEMTAPVLHHRKREGEKPVNEHFVSGSCDGVRCAICRAPATHKVGEEIPHDSPDLAKRHNFTAYVCCAHFGVIFGGAAQRWCSPPSEKETK